MTWVRKPKLQLKPIRTLSCRIMIRSKVTWQGFETAEIKKNMLVICALHRIYMENPSTDTTCECRF